MAVVLTFKVLASTNPVISAAVTTLLFKTIDTTPPTMLAVKVAVASIS